MQNADFTKKKQNIIKHKNLLPHIKIGKEILTFEDIQIKKYMFYRHESPTCLKDVNIKKVLVSKKISFGEKKNLKYFISYLYNDNKGNPVHIMFPKTSDYVKSYDGKTKWMHFLFEDVWDKVSADIKIEFDSEPVKNYKTFLETKIKPHADEVTDFYEKEIAAMASNYTF